MIFKKILLTELEKKKRFSERQYIFLGRVCFLWGGRSTANQHFFKVGLISVAEQVDLSVWYVFGVCG